MAHIWKTMAQYTLWEVTSGDCDQKHPAAGHEAAEEFCARMWPISFYFCKYIHICILYLPSSDFSKVCWRSLMFQKVFCI